MKQLWFWFTVLGTALALAQPPEAPPKVKSPWTIYPGEILISVADLFHFSPDGMGGTEDLIRFPASTLVVDNDDESKVLLYLRKKRDDKPIRVPLVIKYESNTYVVTVDAQKFLSALKDGNDSYKLSRPAFFPPSVTKVSYISTLTSPARKLKKDESYTKADKPFVFTFLGNSIATEPTKFFDRSIKVYWGATPVIDAELETWQDPMSKKITKRTILDRHFTITPFSLTTYAKDSRTVEDDEESTSVPIQTLSPLYTAVAKDSSYGYLIAKQLAAAPKPGQAAEKDFVVAIQIRDHYLSTSNHTFTVNSEALIKRVVKDQLRVREELKEHSAQIASPAFETGKIPTGYKFVEPDEEEKKKGLEKFRAFAFSHGPTNTSTDKKVDSSAQYFRLSTTAEEVRYHLAIHSANSKNLPNVTAETPKKVFDELGKELTLLGVVPPVDDKPKVEDSKSK